MQKITNLRYTHYIIVISKTNNATLNPFRFGMSDTGDYGVTYKTITLAYHEPQVSLLLTWSSDASPKCAVYSKQSVH